MEIFFVLLGLILAGSAFGALAQLIGDLVRDRFAAEHHSVCIERLHSVLSICLIPASLANLRARRRTNSLDIALVAQVPLNFYSLQDHFQFHSPSLVSSTAYAKLCTGIDVAIAMTRALAVTHSESGVAVDYDKLASAWCEVVAAATELERLFIATLNADAAQSHASRSALLNDLSFIVLEGGWPCVDDDGAITDRAHLERRLSRRLGVDIAATLISGSSVSMATITDVSLGGLRLTCGAILPIGTHVTIATKSVGVLKGRVVWAVQPSLGIHLELDCRAAVKQLYGMALRDCDRSAEDSYPKSEVSQRAKIDN